MPDVFLAFDDESLRDTVVERLQTLGPLPDGAFVQDGDGVRLALDGEDPHAGIVRAQSLIRGVLDGTDLDPDRIRLSTGGFGPRD